MKLLKKMFGNWISRGLEDGLRGFSEEVERGEHKGGYWFKPKGEKKHKSVSVITFHEKPKGGFVGNFIRGYVDDLHIKNNDVCGDFLTFSRTAIVEDVVSTVHPADKTKKVRVVYSYQVVNMKVSIPEHLLTIHFSELNGAPITGLTFVAGSDGVVDEFTLLTKHGPEEFLLVGVTHPQVG